MDDLIGGLDEVGYGSWAGPIISVVAVFNDEGLARLPSGVTDSKKTSAKKRSMLYLPIIDAAVDVGFGHAWPSEIDTLGVSSALQLSYRRALEELKYKPRLLIVDGMNRVTSWPGEQRVEPKADLHYQQVSAASMVAKHFRDQMMTDYSKKFPAYGWAKNKGYGAYDHEEAIRKHGLLIIEPNYLHRQHYCRKVLLRTQ
jgi:ribonuclease HII